MAPKSSRSPAVRFGVGLGVAAAVAVAMAARAQTASQPKAMLPAPTSVPAQPAVGSPQDSTSAQGARSMADSAQPSMTQKEIPATRAMWPVDPATGMTLINGEPVVGRVFVHTKTDGLRKYEGVLRHYVGEPLPPEAPIVSSRNLQPPPQAARRHRGIMVEATLWANERHKAAMENHHYRPTTTLEATSKP